MRFINLLGQQSFEKMTHSAPVDCIEFFCQVNEASKETHLLFSRLFVDLSYSKYHVNGVMARSETTLGVWKSTSILCNRVDHPVKDNTFQNLSCDGEKRSSSVIATIFSTALVFEEDDNCSIPKIVPHYLLPE